jgi:hypothetical protein
MSTTTLFSQDEARAVAAEIGGTAHPLNPHDPADGWYVLGEVAASDRTRSRWERGEDGSPVIAGEGAPL